MHMLPSHVLLSIAVVEPKAHVTAFRSHSTQPEDYYTVQHKLSDKWRTASAFCTSKVTNQ
jgi:hypothetical protein